MCRFHRENDSRPRGVHPVQSDDARSTITYEGLLGSMELGVSAIVPRSVQKKLWGQGSEGGGGQIPGRFCAFCGADHRGRGQRGGLQGFLPGV